MPRGRKPSLADRLAALEPPRRTMFAAACAERVIAFYRPYDAECARGGLDALRRAPDAVWRSAGGAAYDGPDEAELGPFVPDVDSDPSPHAPGAQSAALAVLAAVRTRITGDPADAEAAADMVDEVIESKFGSADLAAYHREIDKLAGLSPAEIFARVTELNRRPPRDPDRRNAAKVERKARDRVLAALESDRVAPQDVRALARSELLPPS